MTREDWKNITWLLVNKNNSKLKLTSPINQLEKYFSTFMAHFMFNDAAINISDTQDFINKKRNEYYDEIHLYSINGKYFPQSYILEATYLALKQIDAIYNDYNMKESGIEVRFISPPADDFNNIEWPYKGKIDKESAGKFSASLFPSFESKTKISLHFLPKFFSILQALSSIMDSK